MTIDELIEQLKIYRETLGGNAEVEFRTYDDQYFTVSSCFTGGKKLILDEC